MFRRRIIVWISVAIVLSLIFIGSLHHQGHIKLPVKPVKDFIGWEEIEIPLDDPETSAISPFTDSTVRIYIGVVYPCSGLIDGR
jgi:hypothetical protein